MNWLKKAYEKGKQAEQWIEIEVPKKVKEFVTLGESRKEEE